MKRVALIVIPFFLIVSIAVTVYLVVTQRIELRKKAEERFTSGFCSQGGMRDQCSGGPFVEIEQVSTTYDPQTQMQTYTLKAKRIVAAPDQVTVYPSATPRLTPAECASRGDCPEKTCKIVSACMNQSCIYENRPEGFTCTGGRCDGNGNCVAPTATSVPTPAATATIPPAPTETPAAAAKEESASPSPTGEVQGVSVNAKVSILTKELGCSNSKVGMCSNCDASDPNFTNQSNWHILQPGQNEITFSYSVKRYNADVCGCFQMDFYIEAIKINDVEVSCPGRSNNNYLCAVGSATDCTEVVPTTPVTPTLIVQISPTITPFGPTSTPTPTLTPTVTETPDSEEKLPVCGGLSASVTSGTAPLTVHFTASASDPNSEIKKTEFNYGDGKTQTIEKDLGNSGTIEIDHTYTLSGNFEAYFRIQNGNGDWSDLTDSCKIAISTAGGPTVTPSPTTSGGVGGTSSSSVSATPKTTVIPTAVEPNVPKSGNITPTIVVGLSGLLVVLMGFLVTL